MASGHDGEPSGLLECSTHLRSSPPQLQANWPASQSQLADALKMAEWRGAAEGIQQPDKGARCVAAGQPTPVEQPPKEARGGGGGQRGPGGAASRAR